MKLTRLAVKNLRCIESLEVFPRNYTSLIGPNNGGKSSLLRAMELLLNQQKPKPEEWRKGHEAETIEIQADFEQLEEWERKKPGVASLVYKDRIRLRMTATLDRSNPAKPVVSTVYEAEKPEETLQGWAEKWTELDPEIRQLAEASGLKGKEFASKSGKEKVRQLVRDGLPAKCKLGEPAWTSDGISLDGNGLAQAIPQAQLIPAVRDAQVDGAPGVAKTTFGELLKKVIIPAVQGSAEYKQLIDAAELLRKLLKAEEAGKLKRVEQLTKDITERLSSVIEARVQIGMDLPDAQKFVGTNTFMTLDDGTETPIELQGHGLQRCLIFALLEVLASEESAERDAEGKLIQSRSTLLLFEEPELFIHPHLMRRLKKTLEAIAGKKDWQVIVSTHSPFMVDVATDPLSLVIHQRPDPKLPPVVNQLKEDPFSADPEKDANRERLRAVLDFHPTTCEAFFAKRAVLVEGDSEVAVLTSHPKLHALAGATEANVRDTSIVSCSGKWTIPAIARVLHAFRIPIRVIHDMDAKGKTPEELVALPAIHPYKANARIAGIVGAANVFVVEDTLEHILWPEAKDIGSDKPYQAWKRVAELCDAKANLEHAPKLRDMVRFAFGPMLPEPNLKPAAEGGAAADQAKAYVGEGAKQ